MSTDLYFLQPNDIVQRGDVYVNAKGNEIPVPNQLIGHRPPKGMAVYRETPPAVEPLTPEQQRTRNLMLGALRDLKGGGR